MTKLIPLAIVTGAFAIGVPAAALPNTQGSMAGPTAAANGLTFNAIGEIIYDSNALRISDGGTLARGEKHKEDIRYSPALNAQYVRAVGRTSLTVNGLVGRDYNQYNTYLNRNRFAGGGLLSYQAASCLAAVNGNYSNRQNGVRDFGGVAPVTPVIIDPNPDDVGRLIDNRQIAVTYGANLTCGMNGRLSFGGGAQHSELRNASIARQFADSNSNVYSLFAGLGVFRPGQLQVNGSYSTIGYPNRLTTPGQPVPPFALNSGVKTYRVGLSYTRPIGTKLTGMIGASYLTARPDGPQSPYTSPAYDFSLTYIASVRTTFGIVGSRSILASQTAGALFRVVDQVALTASYRLGETIFLNANAGLISNNYKQPFTTIGQPARRSESTKQIGAGVSYAPRPLYDVGLSVSQTFRNSDPSIFNYSSTKVSLNLAIHL